MFSSGHNATNFFETVLPNEFFEFRNPLGSRHQNDVAHRFSALERINRMGQDRPVSEQGQQLVESHSLTAAARDDDGGQH